MAGLFRVFRLPGSNVVTASGAGPAKRSQRSQNLANDDSTSRIEGNQALGPGHRQTANAVDLLRSHDFARLPVRDHAQQLRGVIRARAGRFRIQLAA
jgi:hypothetical protein